MEESVTMPVFPYRSLVGTLTDDREGWQRATESRDLTDRRDGAVYAVRPELHLAVDVALATGRPLLLRGEPGSGKSSLAAYIARNLGWRYYEHVVTSTTAAEDLLWRFDAVRRLGDAQARRPLVDERYVEPGPLWWVLNPVSAAHRGKPNPDVPYATEPFGTINARRKRGHAVVLIDELDKADPDVPNGLLVPLGSGSFTVAETGFVVDGSTAARADDDGADERADDDGSRLLVVITTNEERQLPPALLRRCVVHTIPQPTVPVLEEIAALHFCGPAGDAPTEEDAKLFTDVAQRLIEVRAQMADAERLPSTAEYLDAVRACRKLGVTPVADDPIWAALEQVVLAKPGPRDETRARG